MKEVILMAVTLLAVCFAVYLLIVILYIIYRQAVRVCDRIDDYFLMRDRERERKEISKFKENL